MVWKCEVRGKSRFIEARSAAALLAAPLLVMVALAGAVTAPRASAQTAPRANEVQTVNVSADACDTAGDTYSLAFQGVSTPALVCDTVTGPGIQAALEALSTVGAGNVRVFGLAAAPGADTPYSFTIVFTGDLAGIDVPLITAAVGRDTGGDGATPTVVEGVPGTGGGGPQGGGGGLSGTPPSPGGMGLMVATRTMTRAQIQAEFANSGCDAAVLAIIEGGRWRIHITGAPDRVNAGFPVNLQPNTPFFVRCAGGGATGQSPEFALTRVVAAIQSRDQAQLRNLSADPGPDREQERTQAVAQLAACAPAGATLGLEGSDVTVQDEQAEARVRLRLVLGDTGVNFQETWQLVRTADGRWELANVPVCSFAGALGPGTGTLDSVMNVVVEAIRDRDRDRLRDHTGDGTPDRIQERDHRLDQLATCAPTGAQLQFLGAEIGMEGTQATATVRLRLEQNGVGSMVEQTWQFQRTAQNQWQLAEVPGCPFS